MSRDETNSSTFIQKNLSNVKKERKQMEQDATLLSNRIKLLQLEESKTWKHIKETQSKKLKIEEYRKVKEEKARLQEHISVMFERQQEENMQKIKQLKMEIEKNKLNSKKIIQSSKKNSYIEVKKLQLQINEQKIKHDEDYVNDNKKRSTSVKVEHIKQSIRKQKELQLKQNKSKEEYLKKVNKEIEKKQELADKLNTMETLEMELIKKLQNTQGIQQKVISEYETFKKNRIVFHNK
jgi:hypothetical protein